MTSWNWLYLTDFSSSFKKTYLPEDNPADFSFFFDISGRRTCYLAPERFLAAGEEDDGRGVTWAMDIFSVGCVIAELFVESPIFSLSQLFKYRRGEYNPEKLHLSKIADKDICELITHMIQVEPEARYSADEYLNFWKGKAFPEYFYSFLHQYMGTITDPSSGHAPVLPETTNFGEADDRVDRIYNDFDKISYFLGYENLQESRVADSVNTSAVANGMFPLQIDIPNNRHTATARKARPSDDGTLIFLSLIVASLRNTARATSRIRACDLMLAFSERITDEAKLDRVLPFIVVLIANKSDAVKIAALRSMTQLLATVKIVSPVNANVFTEYIRPRLSGLIYSSSSKTKPAVRATYAACLGSLAHTSLRILDTVQALRADGSVPAVDPEAENGDVVNQNLYDGAKAEIVEHFEAHTKALLTDPDASVRRAILGSVSSLCVFFGSPKANDVVLSHLNTYLNDRDWQLKCAFFQTIVGVATFVGSSSFEDFILPLMVQALTDPEEFVVEKVLSSFASMATIGLFSRSRTWEMVDLVARFMVHPNIWIREAASNLVSASTKFLSMADTHCLILPLVRPYLRKATTDLSETALLDASLRPVPRAIFDMAALWSQKAERGKFWALAHKRRTFSFGGPDNAFPTISSKELAPNVLRKLALNEEDEQWLSRLRNLGMVQEDEMKLLALREYIQRTTARKPKEPAGGTPSPLKNIVKLQDLELTPQTIFFEDRSKKPDEKRRHSSSNAENGESRSRPHTLADALLEASATIDETAAPRQRSQTSSSRSKTNGETQGLSIPGGFGHSRRSPSNMPSPLSSSPSTRVGSWDSANPLTAPIRALDKARLRDDSLTPTTSRRSSFDRMRMKHKSSAISLLNRKDTQKSVAETGTNETNAVGEVETPLTQDAGEALPLMLREEQRQTPAQRGHTAHTYEGHDPNVLKVLNNLATENYPVDELDFGPMVIPVGRRSSKRIDGIESDTAWRPHGIHVASFGEHTGSINRVLPAPDHAFFITASEDGTVKVWDTLRLERNLIHRSRQTYKHAEGTAVTCITFVENTHTFVSCASDGAVSLVKVDCDYVGDTTKYGKLRLKRSYQLPRNEHAVWCEHFRADGKSTLLLATSASRVLALDLRTMQVLYSFSNPLHQGALTTFCLDRKHNWLLLGTAHGVLSFYDLRFRLGVKSWCIPGRAPIHRLAVHPFKGRGRWVCVAAADVSVWDIEKTECREVFQVAATVAPNSKDVVKAFMPQPVPDTSLLSPPASPASVTNPSGAPSPAAPPSDRSVRAFSLAADTPANSTDAARDAKSGYLVTGGWADRRVCFWDLGRVEASVVVSGLAADEPQPRFTVSHPAPGLVLNTEKPSGGAGARATDEGGKKGKGGEGKRKAGGSRVEAMAREQRALLRNHLDAVTDVMVLEGGTPLVVSTDRKGCIFVHQ